MVSVIVCTYNREKYIGKCLEHLAKQSALASDYEVVIIDNNSTDHTASIVNSMIEKYTNTTFRYFLEKQQGHTYARNRGIQESNGHVLSFIDDDAFVYPNFVQAIADHFAKHANLAALGGKILPVYETREPKWMSHYLLTLVSAIDLGNEVKVFPKNKFPIGANMAFRKEVFQKYGLFNVELGRRADGLEGGDEKEVFMRLRKENEQIHYVPEVTVDHIIPEKRIKEDYIKGLGKGVGSSEKKRLKNLSVKESVLKYFSELVKSGASVILFFLYLLKGRVHAATMLLKFRIWVWQGLIGKA